MVVMGNFLNHFIGPIDMGLEFNLHHLLYNHLH